jgi:hypothetical protein
LTGWFRKQNDVSRNPPIYLSVQPWIARFAQGQVEKHVEVANNICRFKLIRDSAMPTLNPLLSQESRSTWVPHNGHDPTVGGMPQTKT